MDDPKYNVNPTLINRRGIYKDVFKSGPGREWSDYQFRCNFPIAMTVAPELFDEEHALHALKLADQILRGPLGLKTLDPADMQYRPYYDNSNDGDDPAIAKGLNYHNVSQLASFSMNRVADRLWRRVLNGVGLWVISYGHISTLTLVLELEKR